MGRGDPAPTSITNDLSRPFLRQTPGCPVWQRNYYDHIIRSETDLQRIRSYITENPTYWEEDSENPAATR